MATRSTAAGLRHRPRFTQILPTLGMTNDLSIATTSSRGRPSQLLRSPRREACGSTGAPSFPPQPSRKRGWWALAWRAVCTRQPAIRIPTDWSSVFPLPEGWFTSCELTTGAAPGTIALKANVPMGIVTLTEPGGARPTRDRAPFSLDLAQAPPGRKLSSAIQFGRLPLALVFRRIGERALDHVPYQLPGAAIEQNQSDLLDRSKILRLVLILMPGKRREDS